MELEEDHLPNHNSININDVLAIEADKNLSVAPIIPIETQPDPGWGVWPDVVDDERLAYMEQLIADNRPFSKFVWPGGDTSLPLISPPSVEEKPVHKRSLKKKITAKNRPLQLKRTTKKESSSRKQRRISNYFVRNGSTSSKSNEQLTEMISELTTQLTEVTTQLTAVEAEQKRLLEMIKQLKQRGRTKRSSLTSLFPRSKKLKKKRRVKSQTQSPLEPTDAPRNNMMPSPLKHEDDKSCHSPTLSQYAAQHHLPDVDNFHDHDPLPHKSPDHVSPIHSSPVHKYPIHISPVHQSPNHSPSLHDAIDHTSPVHNTPERPVGPPTTSHSRRGVIYDARDHPNSPETHHLLYQGLEIFEAIHDASPVDDGLEAPFPPQSPLSPITRPHSTPKPSPAKSTDTGSGFAQHAASVNAFSATATSNRIPPHNSPVENNQRDQNVSEVMELSDSSPPREALSHTPSDAENHLANELFRCPLVPSQSLISPLPSELWDLFHSTISDASHV
ncbi:hypothetical protein Bca4012_023377 [Brassica carinata]